MMVHARNIHEGGSGSLFWGVSGIILVAIGSVALLTQPWSGFNNLKDILDAIAIPLVIAFVSAWLPRSIETAKIQARKVEFTDLVYREIQEAGPFNEDKKLTKWSCHLQKRFLHDAIFKDPKENMDFILSLDPELVYHVSQLWMHYDKAMPRKFMPQKIKCLLIMLISGYGIYTRLANSWISIKMEPQQVGFVEEYARRG